VISLAPRLLKLIHLTNISLITSALGMVARHSTAEIYLGLAIFPLFEKVGFMNTMRRIGAISLASLAIAFPLSACSGEPDVVGVWIAPNGASAFVNQDGSCAGMYYNNNQPLDIGGRMTCAFSGSTLVVSQPPNQATYNVSFSGDSMTLTAGGTDVTFTRG